ncbi:hypothetical protein ATN89_03780 [Comamonas thiooxydans]|nr:hypothetical protein ATN89_03780 [Comamonas thiooxydans]
MPQREIGVMEEKPVKKKWEPVEWEMWRWQVVIVVLLLVLLAVYAVSFGIKGTSSQETWGQFGDFIGGVMNPLVAFAAFYWLTQSVKLQKQELKETRAELRASALAQQEQVENGRKSIRLAALTALTNATESKIQTLRVNIRETESKMQFVRGGGLGVIASMEEIEADRKGFLKAAIQLGFERDAYIDEMKTLLGEKVSEVSPG